MLLWLSFKNKLIVKRIQVKYYISYHIAVVFFYKLNLINNLDYNFWIGWIKLHVLVGDFDVSEC